MAYRDMIWCELTWPGMILFGFPWFDFAGFTWFGLIRQDSIRLYLTFHADLALFPAI